MVVLFISNSSAVNCEAVFDITLACQFDIGHDSVEIKYLVCRLHVRVEVHFGWDRFDFAFLRHKVTKFIFKRVNRNLVSHRENLLKLELAFNLELFQALEAIALGN